MKRRRQEEGAPITTDDGPPAWLTGQFPEHPRWRSWRVCSLRVGAGQSTGFDLLATASGGYHVIDVSGKPPQPDTFYAGSVILGIAGYPLFGLEGEALEQAFNERLADGVELQLLDWTELQEAEIERDGEDENNVAKPTEEISADGSLLVLPVGNRTVRDMPADKYSALKGDLEFLGTHFHVVAGLRCPPMLEVDSIALRGEPQNVLAARRKMQEMLEFYGISVPPPSA